MFQFRYRPDNRHCYNADNGTDGGADNDSTNDGVFVGADDDTNGSDAGAVKYNVDGSGVVEVVGALDSGFNNGVVSEDASSGGNGDGNAGGNSGGSVGGNRVGYSIGDRAARRLESARRITGDSSPSPGGNSAAGRTSGGKTKSVPLETLDLNESIEEKPKPVKPVQGVPKSAAPKVANISTKRSSTKAGDIDKKEVIDFLMGAFGIAVTFGGAHWLIDDDEAEAIAKPLTQILNKMNKKKKDSINGAMAPMLLMVAIGTIVGPRLMMSMKMKPKKETTPNASRNHPNQVDYISGKAAPENPGISGGSEERKSDASGENDDRYDTSVPASLRNLFAE
jgi:hypothetical protein